MTKQRGSVLVFLVMALVFIGGIVAIFQMTGKMNLGIKDESFIFEKLTEIIVKGNSLATSFKGETNLNDPKFVVLLTKVKDYEEVLLKNRKILAASGENGQKYITIIDGINASVSATLIKMEYLSSIRNDYTDIKSGALYNLTYVEAFSDSVGFIKKSTRIKAEVEKLGNMKVDSSLVIINSKWRELLTVRRNFMAALEESLKYKVPYQWELSQSRYPTKEKEMLLEFEKEANTGINFEWLRSVVFLTSN